MSSNCGAHDAVCGTEQKGNEVRSAHRLTVDVYSAGPRIHHQSILQQALHHNGVVREHLFEFVSIYRNPPELAASGLVQRCSTQ